MTHDYYYLVGREIKSTNDVLEWSEHFKKEERLIKQETTPLGYWVSTVFLGVDYNFSNEGDPILFETMVFNKQGKNPSSEMDQDRYRSYEQAELGHSLMMAKWSNKWGVRKYLLAEWWQRKWYRFKHVIQTKIINKFKRKAKK